MLFEKHKSFKKDDWLKFVERTKISVLISPEQYLLGFEKDAETIFAIECVFEEFLATLGFHPYSKKKL